MTINVSTLKDYMGAGLNILITGPAGTGKTAMLKEASDKLGLKMKYYSTSTLDPFSDIIGLPVPTNETKSVEYYRPRDVDEAEIVFFDELNRGETKTLNAVFEMIQFHSINGEPLPKLKCVVAAINPVSDEYTTDELDIALLDRFDVYLEADPVADYTYFKNVFGKAYAKAGITIFNEYQRSYNSSLRSKGNPMGYFSPRRLEKLMRNYKLFPNSSTISSSLPADVILSKKRVEDLFSEALNPVDEVSLPDVTDISKDYYEARIDEMLKWDTSKIRNKSNVTNCEDFLSWAETNDPYRYDKILTAVALSLNFGIGVKNIKTHWGSIVQRFSDAHFLLMINQWYGQKLQDSNSLRVR